MKKILVGLGLGLMALVAMAVPPANNFYQLAIGRGGYFPASNTPLQIKMATTNGADSAQTFATQVSIVNLGTNAVFVVHDCLNAATFIKAVANNEVTPLDQGDIFSFHSSMVPSSNPNGDLFRFDVTRFYSIWMMTTNGTSTIKIGAY